MVILREELLLLDVLKCLTRKGTSLTSGGLQASPRCHIPHPARHFQSCPR